MEKIRKKVNTPELFRQMLKTLVERTQQNLPVSSNPMMDGMIIGWMISTEKFTQDLFLERELGLVLDGTLQKLEHIALWVCDNEEELCKIL